MPSPATSPYESFPAINKKTFSPRKVRTFTPRRVRASARLLVRLFSPRRVRASARLLVRLSSTRAGCCVVALMLLGVVACAGASVVADPPSSVLRTSTTIPSIVEALPSSAAKTDNVAASEAEAEDGSGAEAVGAPAAGVRDASTSLAEGASAPGIGDASPSSAEGIPSSGNAPGSEVEDVLLSGSGDASVSEAESAPASETRSASPSTAGGIPSSGSAPAPEDVPPSEPRDASPSTPEGGDVLAANDQQTLEALSVAVECCDITYDREEWNKSWTSRVNSHLGWLQAECRYAFYDDTGSCGGSNHRDHLVAVAEAHRSGGHAWERSRKEAFYLDTDNLYVLSDNVNTRKSDKDPSEWAPAVGTCRYAREWVAVKTEWELSVEVSEKQALTRMLNTCPTPPSP